MPAGTVAGTAADYRVVIESNAVQCIVENQIGTAGWMAQFVDTGYSVPVVVDTGYSGQAVVDIGYSGQAVADTQDWME